jgi:membrane-bound lytic murein transglycosylase A
MLVPKSLDPVARGRTMPLPDARPSAKIAKLFPQAGPLQAGPLKDKPNGQDNGVKPAADAISRDAAASKETAKNAAATAGQSAAAVAQAPSAQALAATAIPLPEARPDLEPSREWRRHRRYRRYRYSR